MMGNYSQYKEDQRRSSGENRAWLAGPLAPVVRTCGRSRAVAQVTTGAEKFYFESPSMAMIFKAGELSLVEYGSNEARAREAGGERIPGHRTHDLRVALDSHEIARRSSALEKESRRYLGCCTEHLSPYFTSVQV